MRERKVQNNSSKISTYSAESSMRTSNNTHIHNMAATKRLLLERKWYDKYNLSIEQFTVGISNPSEVQ